MMSAAAHVKRETALWWERARRTCAHATSDLREEGGRLVCAELNCLKPIERKEATS
jgi:hypothetical protein